MRLTALDIRKQEFKNAFRGVDRDEVETFLEVVADEFERVTSENEAQRERLKELESSIAGYRNTEKLLQDTLVTAQKTTDDIRENAKKEAELLIREAEIRAKQVVEEARQEVVQIRQQINELKIQKDSLIAKLRALFSAQEEFLKTFDLKETTSADDIKAGEETKSEDGSMETPRVVVRRRIPEVAE